MLDLKVLIRFFDSGYILKFFLLILLFSLVPLGELYLVFMVGDLLGRYLTLAAAAVTGLAGLLVVYGSAKTALREVKKQVREGVYPTGELSLFAGTIIQALFLLTPGFFTDFLGILLLWRRVRFFTGKIITRKMENQLKEIYEYLRLYDL
ncbi:MAG: FxsA family protein [Spirochaetales bacterium]|jgi:UPF0716 protein FxsA|nr:FxsA family protein [Spirochaetales bacterium]